MKTAHYIFISLFAFHSLFGEVVNASASINAEITSLDHLIAATKQNLDLQKKIREQILHYQQIQDQYLKDTNDHELLLQLVKEGHLLSEAIKANYLTDVFSCEFLSELNLISQIASKRGIPRP